MIFMANEHEENNKRDDGDGENNNATEQSGARFAAIDAVSTWSLGYLG